MSERKFMVTALPGAPGGAAPFARPIRQDSCRQRHDLLLRGTTRVEQPHIPAVVKDHYPVAAADEFGQLRAYQYDTLPATRQFSYDSVDILLGANVYPACGIVEEDHVGIEQE
jgi:hypothetical protein